MQIRRLLQNIQDLFTTAFVGILLMLALPSFVDSAYGQENVDNPNDEVYRVARELWCPLCSGVRLDSCELQACDQMRKEIALRLEAGDDVEAIKAYFVDRYGPQVLGEPPRQGFNWLAWIVPFAALAIGAIVLLTRGRAVLFARSQSPPNEGTADTNPPDTQNTYEEQLDNELRQLR